MKILLDMNIPLKYADLLENRGIESIRWSTIGSPSAADSEIIAFARDQGYVVLTFDLDFSTILALTHASKPSIAQIRASILQAEQAVDLIVSALHQNEDALERGAILSIDLQSARLRLLPI